METITLTLTKEELIAINYLLQTEARIDLDTPVESAYAKTFALKSAIIK